MSDVRLLHLRSAGMFSNVNEVVEQLRLSELSGYKILIDWSESCYADPGRVGDPWSYYFEPLFPDLGVHYQRNGLPTLARGGEVACTRDNIITPRLRDGDCNPLLLPKDREGANRLIKEYISVNSTVKNLVNTFYQQSFRGPPIGIHIRGPGRTDGGAPELRRKYVNDGKVPIEPFFNALDERLARSPDAQILACSDSAVVVHEIITRYGERVVNYDAIRSEFGEMHANHPENRGTKFDSYKLGMDVLVEALLLSRTQHFIHGNSNVANFVLCMSPTLNHTYVLA